MGEGESWTLAVSATPSWSGGKFANVGTERLYAKYSGLPKVPLVLSNREGVPLDLIKTLEAQGIMDGDIVHARFFGSRSTALRQVGDVRNSADIGSSEESKGGACFAFAFAFGRGGWVGWMGGWGWAGGRVSGCGRERGRGGIVAEAILTLSVPCALLFFSFPQGSSKTSCTALVTCSLALHAVNRVVSRRAAVRQAKQRSPSLATTAASSSHSLSLIKRTSESTDNAACARDSAALLVLPSSSTN